MEVAGKLRISTAEWLLMATDGKQAQQQEKF
jgi:hypothetical protein